MKHLSVLATPTLQKLEGFRVKASEGEVVVPYFEHSATQNLQSSGFPEGEITWQIRPHPSNSPMKVSKNLSFYCDIGNKCRPLSNLCHVIYATKVAILLAALSLLITVMHPDLAMASEKIGNLVFNAMQEIQETHQTFLSDVQQIRKDRNAAVAERESVKKQYEKAEDGSLDKKELHARYSYAQAKVFRGLYDEAKLTRKIAGKQLSILNRLKDSIVSGEDGVNGKIASSVVNASKPFLANGKSLLNSLAQYRDKIADPVINSKLNAAYDTARMLSKYVQHIESSRTNKYASQQVLKQKVAELIEQLNALYVQTDIFMAMVRDKSTLLKIITELAASDVVAFGLVQSQSTVNELYDGIMTPMMNELRASDQNIDALFAGVFENHQEALKTAGSQKWTNADF